MTNDQNSKLKLKDILKSIKDIEDKMKAIKPEDIELLGDLYSQGNNLIKEAEKKIKELEKQFNANSSVKEDDDVGFNS